MNNMQNPAFPSNPCYPPQSPIIVQPTGVDPSIVLQMQSEISRLQTRLAKSKSREAAYARLFCGEHGGYVALSPSSAPIPITNFHFTAARILFYDPLFHRPPEIELTLSCSPHPLLIAEKDFFHAPRFLTALQQHARCQINAKPSAHRAAELLRDAAAVRMDSTWIPFFAGWTQDLNTEDWHFQTFSGLRTCAAGTPRIPLPPQEVLPAAAAVAASNLTGAYAAVTAPWLRGTLLLWQHAAFLATVLREEDALPGKALLLTPPSPAAESLVIGLLSFPGEKAVSLDAAPEDFAAALAFAKDRPLLLRDGNSPAPSLANSRLLHTALCGGTVPLFSGKNACRLPLRTLPLILGTDVSSLSALSSVICLNPRREDFSTGRPPQPAFSPEYGYALAAFAARTHSRLAACLAEGKTWGCSLADRLGLSSGHGEVLAALEGIRRFLNDFFAGIDLPPAVPEDWWEGLAEAMTADRQRACPEGLAAIFLEGVRSMVRSERFSCHPKGRRDAAPSPWGSVYYDADACYLDQAAFSSVCRELGLQPGLVKRELRREGLLLGKSCSAGGYETRISSWNAYGQPAVLLVYALRREAVDLPGEPPLLPL